jgi:hypothetical protein
MRTPDASYVSTALAATETPCVSIYLPTHRSYPDNQQDAIRYKNLVGRVEDALAKSYPGRTARDLTDRLRRLEADPAFWDGAQDTVVVLASPSRLDTFTLPRTVPERTEVGETFHVKPLLRHVQSADRFHVLGLARERVALFHGNRYELTPLEVPGVPLTLTDALGEETEPTTWRHHTAGPGSAVRNPTGTHGAAITSGQGGWKDEIPIDTRRFFQAVDRAVTRLVSEPSGLPLIAAGVEDNLAEFRAVTKNRFVSAGAVTGDWTNWNLNEIREKAWKAFEKQYLDTLATIREDYGTAAARGQATQHLNEAAKAAAEGRVGILLIDADKTMPGSIDKTGEPRPARAGDPQPGDMLDDLAELGLKTKARVIVTPSANMPTDTGLAAIFRY